MARPIKNGLAYFPFDSDFFDDDKIADLLDAHGTAGVTVYLAILCLIYRNGYYVKTDVHKLARAVERKIGNRWLKNNLTEKIIHTIISLGLLDSGFAMSGVITSAAVQRRYFAATLRRKVNTDEYWLLSKASNARSAFPPQSENFALLEKREGNAKRSLNEEIDRALESAPENGVSATETGVIVTETEVNVTETPIKENKNKITTTTTIKAPSFHEVYAYFKSESMLGEKMSAASETAKFIAYNANRQWDCLPHWKEAADLWAVRADEK